MTFLLFLLSRLSRTSKVSFAKTQHWTSFCATDNFDCEDTLVLCYGIVPYLSMYRSMGVECQQKGQHPSLLPIKHVASIPWCVATNNQYNKFPLRTNREDIKFVFSFFTFRSAHKLFIYERRESKLSETSCKGSLLSSPPSELPKSSKESANPMTIPRAVSSCCCRSCSIFAW